MNKGKMLLVTKNLLQRNRVDMLLNDAIQGAYASVVAGAGFGKTVTVSAYLHHADVDVAWMQLTELDNDHAQFWTSLCHVLKRINPSAAMQLEEMGFPNVQSIAQVVHLFEQGFIGKRPFVLVLDEYETVIRSRVDRFIEWMVSAAPVGLCILLLSRESPSLRLKTRYCHGLPAQISESDLQFTPAEAAAVFKNLGLPHDMDALTRFCEKISGWPIGIYLLVNHVRKDPVRNTTANLVFPHDLSMFGAGYYDNYSREVQLALVRLAMLNRFDAGIVAALAGGANVGKMLVMMEDNRYIQYDPGEQQYIFQPAYRAYLLERIYTLSAVEQQRVYSVTADACMAQMKSCSFVLDAVAYYRRCGRYDDMCNAIVALETFADRGSLNAETLSTLIGIMREDMHFIPVNATAESAQITLTKREQEVLDLLDQNLSRQEVGERLYITLNTVKAVIRRLYDKLDAANKTEALRKARAYGLLK